MRLDVVVVDLNPAVTEACAQYGFKTITGDILNEPGILVSPANSFGYMDGGIDLAYARRYRGLEDRVKAEIMYGHRGEMPVGLALPVPIPEGKIHPYLIVAPTMRTPATDLRGTVNAYLAMRAAAGCYLRVMEQRKMSGLEPLPLLTPGLGTLSGRMDPEVAARQMAEGVDAAINGPRLFNPWTAQKDHEHTLAGRGRLRW